MGEEQVHASRMGSEDRSAVKAPAPSANYPSSNPMVDEN